MRKILFIRHAHADAEDFKVPDFERNLTSEGLQAAEKLGQFLSSRAIEPEVIFYSTARRTSQTAEVIRNVAAPMAELSGSMLLYNASFDRLLKFLQSQSHTGKIVALVAHNPGISQLASVLSEGANFQFAPSEAVLLEFPIETWAELKPGTGRNPIAYYHS
jgi:phosphohistidine phosphatase